MVDRTIYRGDDYFGDRPVLVYTLVDGIDPETDEAIPLNMAGCTIRTTFKISPTDPDQDPADATAPVKADIVFDIAGAVAGTPLNWELPPGGTAAEGVLYLALTRDETVDIPLGVPLKCDVQLTDPLNRNRTIPVLATLTAIEGYTNRGTA